MKRTTLTSIPLDLTAAQASELTTCLECGGSTSSSTRAQWLSPYEYANKRVQIARHVGVFSPAGLMLPDGTQYRFKNQRTLPRLNRADDHVVLANNGPNSWSLEIWIPSKS